MKALLVAVTWQTITKSLFMRPLQATIHLAALRHNLGVVKACAPHSKVIAVVKANGYGHGLLNAAQGLKACDMFAVLRLEEALTLREAHYQHPILLLEGVFHASELPYLAQYALSMVVHTEQQVTMLEHADLSHPIQVFVKMNSGMNRLGFKPEVFKSMVARLAACANVSNVHLMTHFATADDARGIASPLVIFQQTTQGLNHPVSLANSATILRHPQAHADWVRPGIMLYGASPSVEYTAASVGLKPVMQLTSQIITTQTLQAGESVGYGALFTADKPMRIGIVACGYADGDPRHAPTGTPIAVSGKLTRTLGRVSMDMLAVDISDFKEADIGAAVELWGDVVPVDDVAHASATIGYELLCAVSSRVPVKVME